MVTNYNNTSMIFEIPSRSSASEQRAGFEIRTFSIPPQFNKHYVSISFYKEAECLNWAEVQTGTIKVTSTDDGQQFGDLTNGTVDLGDKSYPRPNWGGVAACVRAVASVGLEFKDEEFGADKKYFIKFQVHSYR